MKCEATRPFGRSASTSVSGNNPAELSNSKKGSDLDFEGTMQYKQ